MARRLGLLIVFGIVHQFLQPGEALLFYGVLGFALLPFCKRSPKIALGMALLLLPLGIIFSEFLMILSMFYLGMFVGKMDYFTDLSRYRKQIRILWLTSVLLVVSALSMQIYWPNPVYAGALQNFAGIIIAAAIVTSLMLWSQSERALGWLAASGRMTLTNYLMQTFLVLAITLAAGGYGALPVRTIPFIWLAIFPIQIILSNLWLRRVLELLVEEGYVKLENYFVDGSKVEANANRHKAVWAKSQAKYQERLREKVKELLKEIEAVNEAENEEYGDNDLEELGGGGEVDAEKLEKKIAELNQRLKEQPEDKKLVKAVKVMEKDYLPRQKRTACLIPHLEGVKASLSVIARRKPDLFPKPEGQSRYLPQNISADAGYGSEENYVYFEEHCLGNYVKYNTFHREQHKHRKPVLIRKAIFRTENLPYEAETDAFICPANQRLTYRGTRRERTDNGYWTEQRHTMKPLAVTPVPSNLNAPKPKAIATCE